VTTRPHAGKQTRVLDRLGVVIGIGVAILALGGCTINDPTEYTVLLHVTNDLGVPARFGTCSDYRCRDRKYVDDDGSTLRPGETSTWNANSDPTTVNPFLVEPTGRTNECLFVRFRTPKHDGSVRLSEAVPCGNAQRVVTAR
jgi:hypothetical protein